MKVTGIEEISKSKCRILFEDESAFVLYKRDLRRYNIFEGAEVTDKQLNVFFEEILPYRSKARCMKLLQSKDYTEGEIRKKLQSDGYPQRVIDKAVSYLYSYSYLDDEKYAILYYQSRCGRKSKKQIIMELQQKGIAKDTIMTILEKSASESEEEKELQCIRKLLIKKKYIDSKTDMAQREKIKAYLFRKGFEMNDINVCMRNFNWENM